MTHNLHRLHLIFMLVACALPTAAHADDVDNVDDVDDVDDGIPWTQDDDTVVTTENGDRVETIDFSRGTDTCETWHIVKRYRECWTPDPLYGGDGTMDDIIVTWQLYQTVTDTTSLSATASSTSHTDDQSGPNGSLSVTEYHMQATPGVPRTMVTQNSRMYAESYGPTGAVIMTTTLSSAFQWSGILTNGDWSWQRAEFGNVLWQETRSDPGDPNGNGSDDYMRVTTYSAGQIVRNEIASNIDGDNHHLVAQYGTNEFDLDNVVVAPDQVIPTTLLMLNDEQRCLDWQMWSTWMLPNDLSYLIGSLAPPVAN